MTNTGTLNWGNKFYIDECFKAALKAAFKKCH